MVPLGWQFSLNEVRSGQLPIVEGCPRHRVRCPIRKALTQAMCFTVIIGFSIDFVLHIAVAYAQRPVRAQTLRGGGGGGDGVYARSERHVRTARAHDELLPAITKAALTTGVMALFALINPLLTARRRHHHDDYTVTTLKCHDRFTTAV